MNLLFPIETGDVSSIYRWPPYDGSHAQMDYAVRENGWLDTYCSKAGNICYAAKVDGVCVGFSLLIRKTPTEAEFRVAVHPEHLGSGYGGRITQQTLTRGFLEHHLEAIMLIVRKNNPVARHLYEKRGFVFDGETTESIQGKPIDFDVMKMTKASFMNGLG
jgi:RimJ/RimL family protein N-acetyltransferase